VRSFRHASIAKFTFALVGCFFCRTLFSHTKLSWGQSSTLDNCWPYFSCFRFHSLSSWHRASIRLRICSTLPPSRQLRSQATSTFAYPCPPTHSHIRQRGSLSSAIPLIHGLAPHAALAVTSLTMPHLDDPFSWPAVALIPPLHTVLSVFVLSFHPIFLNLFVKIRGLTPL